MEKAIFFFRFSRSFQIFNFPNVARRVIGSNQGNVSSELIWKICKRIEIFIGRSKPRYSTSDQFNRLDGTIRAESLKFSESEYNFEEIFDSFNGNNEVIDLTKSENGGSPVYQNGYPNGDANDDKNNEKIVPISSTSSEVMLVEQV